MRIQQAQEQQYKSHQKENQGFKKPSYNNRPGNSEERSFRYEEKGAKKEVNSGGAKRWDFKDPKIQFPCPLKCAHKVAFGSTQNCHNFRVKSTTKERQEKVLKFFLCRKCLKAARKVNHESMSDCKARTAAFVVKTITN